jgi:hypothetical protein
MARSGRDGRRRAADERAGRGPATLINVVLAGIGGVFVATGSTTVTAIAAVVALVIAVLVVVIGR